MCVCVDIATQAILLGGIAAIHFANRVIFFRCASYIYIYTYIYIYIYIYIVFPLSLSLLFSFFFLLSFTASFLSHGQAQKLEPHTHVRSSSLSQSSCKLGRKKLPLALPLGGSQFEVSLHKGEQLLERQGCAVEA